MYLSIVPGHKKLLPRPCPQCGQENGGVQFVFFNPRYYEKRTGYRRYEPYHLLRISHYSKEEYRLKKHKPTKIWHTFRFLNDFELNKKGRHTDNINKSFSIDELFDEPDYMDKQSVTLPLTPLRFEAIREKGWRRVLRIIDEGAHWLNKATPKQCPKCEKVVDSLKKCIIWHEEEQEYPFPLRHWYYWMCNSCVIEKEAKRLANKQLIANPSLLPS